MLVNFIRELINCVNQLADEGKLFHIDSNFTNELELLYLLPWERCEFIENPSSIVINPSLNAKRSVLPFDLAYGWLKLSKALLTERSTGSYSNTFIKAGEDNILRAAQYAELACLCMRIKVLYSKGEFSCGPYSGSLTGATVAWDFIAKQFVCKYQNYSNISGTYYHELQKLKS